MKLFAVVLFVAVASADRLENTYLPPVSSRTAGGSGNFLATPFKTGGGSFGAGFGKLSSASAFNSHVPVATTYSAQTYSHSAPVSILRFDNQNNGDGSYQYQFETQNNINQHESGHLKNADTEEVHGSYSYISPEGQHITVNYVADENGFQAAGDHLPTPPPVPKAILESLELNARTGGSDDDGQYRPSHEGQYRASISSGSFQTSQLNRQYLAPKTTYNQGGYHY